MAALMVLMLVVVAQGTNIVHPDMPTGQCVKKCSVRCAFKIVPALVARCFGICMLVCKIEPPQAVIDCTSDCVKSAYESNPQHGISTSLFY